MYSFFSLFVCLCGGFSVSSLFQNGKWMEWLDLTEMNELKNQSWRLLYILTSTNQTCYTIQKITTTTTPSQESNFFFSLFPFSFFCLNASKNASKFIQRRRRTVFWDMRCSHICSHMNWIIRAMRNNSHTTLIYARLACGMRARMRHAKRRYASKLHENLF